MTSCQKISFAASPLLAADRTTSGRHEPRIPQTARRNGLGFPRPRFGPRPKRPKNTKQTYSMALLMYCLYLLLSAYSPSRNSRAKVAYLSFGRKRKREREREKERELGPGRDQRGTCFTKIRESSCCQHIPNRFGAPCAQ